MAFRLMIRRDLKDFMSVEAIGELGQLVAIKMLRTFGHCAAAGIFIK